MNNASTYVIDRRNPWDALGETVTRAMTASEALASARMDWEVKTKPVFVEHDGQHHALPNKTAIYRDNPDGGAPFIFNVVSKKWTPVQNVEAFAFLDSLIEAKGGAHYETAGVLKDGARVFMTVKMPEDLILDPNGAADRIENYILVANGHDGMLSFSVAVTPIRVACHNAVTAAFRKASRVWRLTHTKSIAGRMEEARQTLDLTFKYAEEFVNEATALIETDYSDRQFDSLVRRLYPLDADASERAKNNVAETRDKLTYFFREAETQENIRNTRWAAYQSVVEYVDFGRNVRGGASNTAEEKRARDILFGKGIDMKQKALELLTV